MRYSIGQLLFLFALVSVACFIWVAPTIVHVPLLFVATLIIPGPLAILWRHGGRKVQSFALGALVTYVAWILVGALPCVALVAYRFTYDHNVSLENLQFEIDYIASEDYYTRYVGLYAPWIIVPLAGMLSVVVHFLFGERS